MTYLLDHPNPNAPLRSDGNRFWGYPSRSSEVRLLVIHTTESAFDTSPPDTGAENVAKWMSRTETTVSYHDIADSDSLVRCLPHDYTAFAVRGYNSVSINMAFAGQASKWHTLSDDQVTARLEMLASRARTACAEWDIPIRRLHGSAARADGARGICGHTDLDPTRRTDPGAGFPWDRFLRLIQEDDMPLTDDDVDKIFARVWGTKVGKKDYTFAQALDRIYRKVSSLGSGDVDVDALAAALSDQLGADLAAELGRRLAS